jgi:hypothetical protein
MSDQNMIEFYKRAARLEADRARGMGFEATGTLGRSYYQRPAAYRRSLFWPALFLLAVAFVLKGAILFGTGPETYKSRVADLQASRGVVEQMGGWLMQADPVTEAVSKAIAYGVTRAKT